MISKGVKRAIICVLMLVLIVEQVQVEGISCCPDTTKRNCYNVCRHSMKKEICANVCGCKLVSGVKCPRDYPKFNFLPNSDEPDRVEYCRFGCRSSVCDNISRGYGGKQMKIGMESCEEACDNFCNGDVSMASNAAE